MYGTHSFLWSRCTGLELNRWLSTGERIRTGALSWKTQSILIRPYRITKSNSWFASIHLGGFSVLEGNKRVSVGRIRAIGIGLFSQFPRICYAGNSVSENVNSWQSALLLFPANPGSQIKR